MSSRLRLLAALVACLSCGCPTDPPPPGPLGASGSAGPARYLDVRTRHEFRGGHIPGAKNIPVDELAGRLGEIRDWRDGEVATVCQVGARSARAAKLLSARGFTRVRNLDGGMAAWTGDLNGQRLDRVDPAAYRAAYLLGAVLVRVVKPEGRWGAPGLLVRTVFPGGPVAKVLRAGDFISKVAGEALTTERVRSVRYRDIFPLGEKVRVTVQRAGTSRPMTLTMRERTRVAGESMPMGPLPADLLRATSASEMSAVVEAGGLDRAAWAPTVLPAVARVHRDLVAGFGTWPDAAAIPVASDVLVQARLTLDRAVRSFGVEFSDRGLDDDARARSREALLLRLQRFAVRARAPLTNGRSTPAVAAARVAESIIVHDLEEQAVSVTEHARRLRATDWAEPLALSYQGLDLIAEVLRRSSWGEATSRAPGVEGEVIAWRETPVGPVVIGGAKANRYRGQFAAIIDLGGNDEYIDIPVAGPALLVDLAGDDLYRLAAPSGPLGAVQLWFDKSGDDRYETTTFGLGGVFHGVQLLLDQSGNDTYAARSLSLGAAIFGVGILIDGAGNDRYRAVRGAMGFGGPHGFGALIDHAGDDVYEAVPLAKTSTKLLHPRASMMQGCGMGIRQLSFGGLGMLIDSAGDDRYEAKEYAQGVGYVGGLGVLLDLAGNDRYRGEKFVQAAGVHAGVGVLRDAAGDDKYLLTRLQGQAAAWDLGIALLEDGRGRDSFHAPKRAQAFAANNGIAVMRLGGANPRLVCEQKATCQGYAGSNDYAGGRGAKSIAVVTLASP